MFVKINHHDSLYKNNVDVKVNPVDNNVTSPTVQERLWESEAAYIESRSFDTEIELIYGECDTNAMHHQERYNKVMQELDFWSECIASSNSREERDRQRKVVRHYGPPEWLYIPTSILDEDRRTRPGNMVLNEPFLRPEWMFVSRSTTL